MADVTITIPQAHEERVIHALCAWREVEETPANAKDSIIRLIKDLVRNIERQEAQQSFTFEDPGIV